MIEENPRGDFARGAEIHPLRRDGRHQETDGARDCRCSHGSIDATRHALIVHELTGLGCWVLDARTVLRN